MPATNSSAEKIVVALLCAAAVLLIGASLAEAVGDLGSPQMADVAVSYGDGDGSPLAAALDVGNDNAANRSDSSPKEKKKKAVTSAATSSSPLPSGGVEVAPTPAPATENQSPIVVDDDARVPQNVGGGGGASESNATEAVDLTAGAAPTTETEVPVSAVVTDKPSKAPRPTAMQQPSVEAPATTAAAPTQSDLDTPLTPEPLVTTLPITSVPVEPTAEPVSLSPVPLPPPPLPLKPKERTATAPRTPSPAGIKDGEDATDERYADEIYGDGLVGDGTPPAEVAPAATSSDTTIDDIKKRQRKQELLDANTYCAERYMRFATPRAMSILIEFCTAKPEFRKQLLSKKRLWAGLKAKHVSMFTPEACHNLDSTLWAMIPPASCAGVTAPCLRSARAAAFDGITPTCAKHIPPASLETVSDMSTLPTATLRALSAEQAAHIQPALCKTPHRLPFDRYALTDRKREELSNAGRWSPLHERCYKIVNNLPFSGIGSPTAAAAVAKPAQPAVIPPPKAPAKPYAENVNGMLVNEGLGPAVGGRTSSSDLATTSSGKIGLEDHLSAGRMNSPVMSSRGGISLASLFLGAVFCAVAYWMWQTMQRARGHSAGGNGAKLQPAKGRGGSSGGGGSGYGGL